MEVYRADKERWMERFKDHSIYLDKLQKEAEQTVCERFQSVVKISYKMNIFEC